MPSVLQNGRTRPVALPSAGQIGPEDIGRGGSLILQGEGSRSACGPASRGLVFLTDAGFVLEPQFERLAGGRRDIREDIGGHFFADASMRPRCEAGISSSIAELIALYSPPMPMPVMKRHAKNQAGRRRTQ